MKSDKLFILCINQNKLLKKFTITLSNQSNYKNGYHIYEFWKQQNFSTNVLILKLTNKLDLRKGEKNIALSNLSISYIWKNIKSSYYNNKFKISGPT